jgi:hypothetical protein
LIENGYPDSAGPDPQCVNRSWSPGNRRWPIGREDLMTARAVEWRGAGAAAIGSRDRCWPGSGPGRP